MIITIPVVPMVTNHNDVLWPLFNRVEVKLCKIQNKLFENFAKFTEIHPCQSFSFNKVESEL